MFCVWIANEIRSDSGPIVQAMGRALRAHPGQTWLQWSLPGLSVGLLELSDGEIPERKYAPATTDGGRYYLWMTGEAFAGNALCNVLNSEQSRTERFRQELLEALLAQGLHAVANLDGVFQLVIWDAHERCLVILNDRFGGLPLYWARSPQGFGFAGGVRGVLAAPGVDMAPDPDALREAVTFGGYRLGDRTNVAAVKMIPGATMVTVRHESLELRRYWRWSDVKAVAKRSMGDLVEEGSELWRQAVRRRLRGARNPGQTLSGGLDSRAILAAAAPAAPGWTAITYGIPGCDDARYAQRAARAAGATWVFHPLYSGRDPDWLDRRTAYVQETDGLIQLGDLMHLETLAIQAKLLDVTFSGYSGDAVCGTTYDDVKDARTLLAKLPFYGTGIGWSWEEALSWAEHAIASLPGTAPRYAIFEHKYSQSIHRTVQAYTAWIRVRKPFLDYDVFEFFEGLKGADVVDLYPRLLRSKYPTYFSGIPHQKTGVPVLVPSWRYHAARARRAMWRHVQPLLASAGLPIRPRVRNYHNDECFWRAAEVRQRIEGMILRPGSLCCEILGRKALMQLLTGWFESGDAPAQVIGALYVFESYHRDLSRQVQAMARPT